MPVEFIMTNQTQQMIVWSKALFECALGKEEGERVWKTIPASVFIAWWLSMTLQSDC